MAPPPATTKPKTPIAFARSAGSVKRRHDQRERDRRDDRAAEPLHRARGDQHPLRRREAARERGEREERDADQEQPAVAEEVAEPAAEQEEAAEGEQVGVHDPRERGLGEAEVLADRRQGDVHDRRVEDDHQVARGRGRAAPASACGCPWSSALSSVVRSRVASSDHRSRTIRAWRRKHNSSVAVPMRFSPAGRSHSSMAAPAPTTVDFAIRGPITRADLPGLCDRVCRCWPERRRAWRSATCPASNPTR